MENTSLRAFISKVLESRRLRFGDLRRLQRDVLPSGISSREEAEALLALDRVLDRADEGWPGYLASTIKGFVLSGSANASWLAASLSVSSPKTARSIAREILLEAGEVDDALRDLAAENPRRRSRPGAFAEPLQENPSGLPVLTVA